MARDRHPVFAGPCNEMAAMGAGITALSLRGLGNMAFEFLETPALLAGEIGSRVPNLRPLALPWRVIHQREQANPDRMIRSSAWRRPVERCKWLEQFQCVWGRELTADVKVMISTQNLMLL